MCTCPNALFLRAPSFKGFFVCPRAVDFCRFETITGVRHPEFRRWQLYVVLALFPGVPLLVTLACFVDSIAYNCCKWQCFVHRLKAW